MNITEIMRAQADLIPEAMRILTAPDPVGYAAFIPVSDLERSTVCPPVRLAGVDLQAGTTRVVVVVKSVSCGSSLVHPRIEEGYTTRLGAELLRHMYERFEREIVTMLLPPRFGPGLSPGQFTLEQLLSDEDQREILQARDRYDAERMAMSALQNLSFTERRMVFTAPAPDPEPKSDPIKAFLGSAQEPSDHNPHPSLRQAALNVWKSMAHRKMKSRAILTHLKSIRMFQYLPGADQRHLQEAAECE